jgi:hypothetical protein
MESPS